MKLRDRIANLYIAMIGGIPQGAGHHNPVKTVMPGMPEILRQTAAEGAVLLQNRVLPFKRNTKVAVFGRVQVNHFYTGYGSGGDVNLPYAVNLLEGLRNCGELQLYEKLAKEYEAFDKKNPIYHGGWGTWPRHYPEMPLKTQQITDARKNAQQAVIILGRASGEDRENTLEPGSYYLTDSEKQMLTAVTKEFPNAVLLLNIGSVMDLSFLKDYSFGAVMILWQGGMESGNAAADLLCGKAVPSGRMTDTVAWQYEDYPSSAHFGGKGFNEYFEDIYVGYRFFETFGQEKVQFPFGYGLSYTTFEKQAKQTAPFCWQVTVTNTGNLAGKETVLLYVGKPCGVLGNPVRELAAFAKTKLLQPGESQTLALTVSEETLASYDDAGSTGHKDCWIIQGGTYRLYLGGDVRMAEEIAVWTMEKKILAQLAEAAAPRKPFPIVAACEVKGVYTRTLRDAAACTVSLKERILQNLPEAVPMTGDRGWKLKDVKTGKISLDDFVAQLSLEELEAISRGGYVMNHPLGAKGNAGIFGGVTESLRDKGILPIVTTDGPSGLRLYESCSLIPIGMLLASTFDTELLEKLFAQMGEEMVKQGSDVLLAPGMNIHRNPLCGRNFEYFSEDPYLTGKIAAAVVRGVQSKGVSACPKHFACNNQEYKRSTNNSILSQRALREIYLKGFEICVKEAKPRNIMTSYNKINGVWGHYHYDLVATILRRQWGYEGNVMTDWWMKSAASEEFPQLRNQAYRVRACVDVLMPGSTNGRLRRPDGTLLKTYGQKNGITLGEMQLCAKHVLRCVMDIKEL